MSRFDIATETVRGWNLPVFVNRHRSITELFDQSAAAFADRTFLVMRRAGEDHRRLTFAETRRQVDAMAAHLQGLGVEPGHRVGLLGANCPEWIVGFFAAVRCGAIVSCLNGWWTEPEIHHAASLTSPRVLLGDAKRLARLGDAALPGLEHTLVFDDDFAPICAADMTPTPVAVDEDDPAVILFTSGTTGRSKGATVSHRGVVSFVDGNLYNAHKRAAAATAPQAPPAPRPPTVILATSPLFHLSGLFGSTMMGVAAGATLVFRSGGFDPADVLRIIEEERVTSWSAIGSMGPQVLAHPDLASRDTSSVTSLGFGGAPVSPTLQDQLRDAFPNAAATMAMGYGSSESVVSCTSIRGADFVARPTSAGQPNVNVELQIRLADGSEALDGADGEVHVRSSATMLGYWDNPEATAATIDADGWLNMGDIGRVEDGWLYLNSRARDMILRNAENVYPIEIEHVLAAHPAVAEVAVAGVDHPTWGQEVKAWVVLQSAQQATAEELRAFAAGQLAPFKVPTSWSIGSKPLPRTASGKIMKGEVMKGEL